MVKTLCFQCRVHRFNTWPKKKKKERKKNHYAVYLKVVHYYMSIISQFLTMLKVVGNEDLALRRGVKVKIRMWWSAI